MLINYGKLEGVTSTEEEISIKCIKKNPTSFQMLGNRIGI